MTIGYFDCSSGVSGDMVLGALVDAGLPFPLLKKQVAQLNPRGFRLRCQTVKRGDFRGVKVHVIPLKTPQRYRGLKEIQALIQSSRLSHSVIEKSLKVFKRLAEAEARVHGKTVSRVHFHEVGAVDTLVDVVGTVVGLEQLEIEKVFFSPINTGLGFQKKTPSKAEGSTEGFSSSPAPATAELLKGVPCFSTHVNFELATPTGVALLTTLGAPASSLPVFSISSIGYGAGDWNPPSHPNLLRFFIGQRQRKNESQEEKLSLLHTNIDDLNPQIYEYLMERLFHQGALDVYLTPIIMKKGRPATLLSVLSDAKKISSLLKIIFHETTTLGVRVQEISRVKLKRRKSSLQTPFGKMKGKKIFQDGTTDRITPEYEACKRMAKETGFPLRDILAISQSLPYRKKGK
ncbi:MAG TPA: nickel pincer cofactor biosynthesis protein LarC [Nitrospiria bacterium]|jgi:uncharacterized protein (TIGR00299 family) protein